MPTREQMYTCFVVMQLLSNTFCRVEVFRYDRKYQKVFILAVNSRNEEIEIEVYESIGQIYFLMNRSDYEAMNRIELRDYLRKNRTDELAWDVFMNKNDASPSKSPLYDAPKSLEDFQQFLENNSEVKAKLGE